MAPAASAVGSLGRGKQRQDRQGLDQAGPRHRGEHHEAQPAQSAGLDEMAVTGAYRITVYPPCVDPVSPSAFDGVVHTDDNRAIGHEPFDHNVQQPPGYSAGAPSGATENLVIACKVGGPGASGHAQAGADGPLAWCQQGAHDQNEHMLPTGRSEAATPC